MISERHIVLECRGLHHRFGSNRVLFDVRLKVARGQIVALVGPSGCGKSTLLQSILGTLRPTQGQVRVHYPEAGRPTAHPVDGPGRDRGIVYQRYSLFPHLTALQNVAFGLMLDQTGIGFRLIRPRAWRALRRQHREQAEAWLRDVGLGHALHKYPHQLSGGMRQRVAIAQAVILKPAILLLDEPFGALDEATREDLQRMLLRFYHDNQQALAAGREPPYTILLVTHELNEAIFVSDRIVGLSQYWNWNESGHDAFPGAAIVYDQPAPVFHPEDPRDYARFAEQKEEVLQAAFEPHVLQERSEWNRFWSAVPR
jgi:NitT/TauT family transport system ATP-binding protein